MEYRTTSQVKKRNIIKYTSIVVLAVIALILFTSLVYSGFSERTSQLSAYSDNWNDMSNFREDVEKNGYGTASIVSSPSMLKELEEPEKMLFVAVGIERAYTTTEAREIYNFIRNGGTAIIADDYGFANSLSKYYFQVSFIGHRLWDSEYEKNPQLVKIDVDPERNGKFYFDGNILLNDPTGLEAGAGVLAKSTNLSWIDNNDNKVQDIEEIPQAYPVIVRKEVDDGSIIFISDSSLFINDMWGRFDNSRFVISLVQQLLDSGGTVIFDESRHIRSNPVDSGRQAVYEALVILTTNDEIRWLTAIITILVLGLLIIGYDDPDELRHIFNVGAFKIRELREPWLAPKDTDRVRYVFLERVRIHLGLSMEEFRDLAKDELEELIGDTALAEFALNLGRTYSGTELNDLFKKIRDWPMSIEPMDAIELS